MKRVMKREKSGHLTEDQIHNLMTGGLLDLTATSDVFGDEKTRRKAWEDHKLHMMARVARVPTDCLFSHYMAGTRPAAYWDYELCEKTPTDFCGEFRRLDELGLIGDEERARFEERLAPNKLP